MMLRRVLIDERHHSLAVRPLVCFALFSMGAIPNTVWAQQAPADASDEETSAGLEQIVVTGSRIGRESVFETVAPTIAVSDVELSKRGFTNVLDALNEIPGFVATQSPTGGQNNLSVGVSFADLYGLGSQRTLTLVDGKRFVSSNAPQIQGLPGGSQVDLNLIPLALIERVETVGVGGAPIYGSDAIAGTVNILMKDDYEGFEVTQQYSTIQNGGDPESYMLGALWGSNTPDGRGNVTLGVEYNRDEGVLVDEFPKYFGAQPSFHEIPSAHDVDGDGTLDPVNRIFYDVRIPVQTEVGGAVVGPSATFLPFGPPFGISQEEADQLSAFPNAGGLLQITEDGELTTFNPGSPIPSDPFAAVGGDGLDRDLRNQLLSPVDRTLGMVNAHYDISPWVEAYGQVNFAHTEARTLADQDALNIFPFDDESAALAFFIDTPFLSDDARQRLVEAGAGDTFFAGVATEAVVDNGRAQTETSLWRVVSGLRGDFEIVERQWQWDISANFGETDAVSRNIGFNDGRFFNAIDAIQLTNQGIQSVIDADIGIDTAEGAIAELNRLSGTESVAAGSVICRVVLEAARGEIPLRGSPAGGAANDVRPNVDGCIPLNVLGQPAPQDAIDWVQRDQITQGALEQRVFNFSLSGEVAELPAGWVEAVAGYENRRELGSFRSDEATQIGIGRNSPILDTEGEFSTDEAFFELMVPVVSEDMDLGEEALGFSLVDQLTLESAFRTVDNSITGRNNVWTAGTRLTFGGVLSDVMFRGNYTESTRSPSIQELFSPRQDTGAFSDDPCDQRFLQEGPAPENRQANCQAAGLDPNFSSLVVRAAQPGLTGGNPDLRVERAKSWSVGGIFTPHWVPDLVVSADYIHIEINDRITPLTLEDQMQACFDQDPNSFDANAGICATFQRDESGQIIDFETGFQNAALSNFAGVQLLAQYQFELTDLVGVLNDDWGRFDWGRVYLTSRAFHRIANKFSVIGEEPERVVGGFDQPDWSGTFDLNWSRGPARFYWRVEWRDAVILDPQGDQFFENLDGDLIADTGARFINDAGFGYTFRDRFTAQLTIDNIFDRDASDAEIAAGHFSLDEIFGRQFRLRLTAGW